jgi:glucokinase
MREIVAVDVGGTNARFVKAKVGMGKRPELGAIHQYRVADHASLADAWVAFARDSGGQLPREAGIAVAGPVSSEVVKFTNSPWILAPRTLGAELGVDRLTLINDFGAVAHAVAWLAPEEFRHLAGPTALPESGVTTIAGLGTGLGVAQLLRRGGRYFAIETEGAHGDFGPVDELEDKVLLWLRHRFVRVSDERIVSGPALANIYEAMAAISGESIVLRDDAALWDVAIKGEDQLAAAALDRLVLSFGSVTGDLALQHGSNQIVITGGIANRIVDRLTGPLFHQRFCSKGRYSARMESFPIRLALHPEPGLLGAAAAFVEEHLK